MATLFSSGRIIDLILLLVAIEFILLAFYRYKTGSGPTPGNLLGNLLAGVFLLLALRTALAGGAWGWTAVYLTLALCAHIMDLRQRWSLHDSALSKQSTKYVSQ